LEGRLNDLGKGKSQPQKNDKRGNQETYQSIFYNDNNEMEQEEEEMETVSQLEARLGDLEHRIDSYKTGRAVDEHPPQEKNAVELKGPAN